MDDLLPRPVALLRVTYILCCGVVEVACSGALDGS